MLENEFQRADSSTAERFNGIEEMAVQFRPCPPVSKWADSVTAARLLCKKADGFDSRRVHQFQCLTLLSTDFGNTRVGSRGGTVNPLA